MKDLRTKHNADALGDIDEQSLAIEDSIHFKISYDNFTGVKEIIAGNNAFAAIKEDGSVFTWGYGPMSYNSMVADKLSSGVEEIVAMTMHLQPSRKMALL